MADLPPFDMRRLAPLCLAEHGDTCWLCGKPGATEADHVYPRASRGDDVSNLRPAHHGCRMGRIRRQHKSTAWLLPPTYSVVSRQW